MKPLDPRLLRQARPARTQLSLTVVAALAAAALTIAQAVLLAHAIVHAGDGWHALRTTLLVLLAVVAGRALLHYAVEATSLRAAAAVRRDLRRRLLRAVVAAGPDGPADRGEVITLATKGLESLDPYFARYLPQLVLAVVVPVAVVATVAGADLTSAIVIGVTLPLIPLFMALVGMHTRARTERSWALLARLGGHFLDVIRGLPTLTVFNRARAQARVIGEISEQHRRATMRTLRIAFLSALVLELLATLATALVAVEVGLRLLAGGLPYATALMVLLLAPEAYLPLRTVGAQFHASMDGATAVGRALDLCDATGEGTSDGPAVGGSGTATCDLWRDGIRLTGVTVRFPDRDRPALDGIDLTLAPGDQVAVLGHSGAGKSTLLSLLLGFRTPDAGGISVGRHAMAALDLAALRRQIAWVPQQPHLVTGSIADNLRMGDPAASDAAIERAARDAGIDLPLGTPVGEGGLHLSSGQRQRVALGRAIVRDAPLVLLDEPTAHLDEELALDVRNRIRRWCAGRTLVVVSHVHGWDGGVAHRLLLDGGRLQDPAATAATA